MKTDLLRKLTFKNLRRSSAAHRLAEEQLYQAALAELDTLGMRGGLWAKALAAVAGDEQKARGLYLKYRVQSMIDEAEVTAGFIEDSVKNAEKHSASNSTSSKSTNRDLVTGTKDDGPSALSSERAFYYLVLIVIALIVMAGMVSAGS
jgi:hypothetical protein